MTVKIFVEKDRANFWAQIMVSVSISLTTDINMLLRKDALMKVDKDWKNMSPV